MDFAWHVRVIFKASHSNCPRYPSFAVNALLCGHNHAIDKGLRENVVREIYQCRRNCDVKQRPSEGLVLCSGKPSVRKNHPIIAAWSKEAMSSFREIQISIPLTLAPG